MQGLYQWQLSKLNPKKIAGQFQDDYDMSHVDVLYFEELINNIPDEVETLDNAFEPYLHDRSLEELDPITLALMRLATYELIHRVDVPYRVVINEAVSLAKKFGAQDSHKFINGVLDKTATRCRPGETTG